MRRNRERGERERGWFRQTGCRLLAAMLVAMILISGCWGDQSGPNRYRVSGKVTYRGESVPKGMIYFDPDTSKGIAGPQGSGTIDNGYYQTDEGRGHVGGPHTVRIIGLRGDALEAPQLFPTYTTQIDLPAESANRDIEVPADLSFGSLNTR